MAGAGISRGALYGKSDATASSPAENPVHPTQILATVYHALRLDSHTIVHLRSTSRASRCRSKRWQGWSDEGVVGGALAG